MAKVSKFLEFHFQRIYLPFPTFTYILFFFVQYYDSVHLASDQKDLLISQLKAEIFEIQQRDKDYLALRDQLYTIQQKYRHVQDEKLMQDNDYNYRHD